jgi:hypothetical protein
MSGATTRAPSGSAAATRPTSGATWLPMATSAGSAPTSRAKESRAGWPASAHFSQEVRPAHQSASAAWRATQAGRGGSP